MRGSESETGYRPRSAGQEQAGHEEATASRNGRGRGDRSGGEPAGEGEAGSERDGETGSWQELNEHRMRATLQQSLALIERSALTLKRCEELLGRSAILRLLAEDVGEGGHSTRPRSGREADGRTHN